MSIIDKAPRSDQSDCSSHFLQPYYHGLIDVFSLHSLQEMTAENRALKAQLEESKAEAALRGLEVL